MDFIDNIEDNSILIIPNSIRNKVLDKLGKLSLPKNIKIMTFNDFKYGLYFDYSNESIYHIMKYFNLTYNIAKSYIDNLYYIEESEIDNDKYRYLRQIKKYLLENKLLYIDKLFIPLLKSKNKIYVCGFTNINKFNKHLLEKASKYISYEIIKLSTNSYRHEVYEFKTIEEEVAYVAENISRLIASGIDINKIYIANYSSSYFFTFNYIFKKFNLPVYIKSDTSLASTSIGKYFLKNLNNDAPSLLENIKHKFNIKNKNNEVVFNKLKALLDTYYWNKDLLEIKELIEAELKKIKISKKHYKNEIKTVDIIDNVFDDDEFVFLINFNLGSIPVMKRDEDYLNDLIKPDILETTEEYNSTIKNSTISSIKNIKNLYITYKLSDNFSEYLPAFLIEDESLEKKVVDTKYSTYSNDYNKLLLAKLTDNLVKFNEVDNNLAILNNSYNINYKTYDNSFNGIDNNKLIEKIDNNINFSYSNIDTYYKCPFRFYLNSILKVIEFKETTNEQFIGTLFHYCLEKCANTDEDPVKVYDDYVTNNLDIRTFSYADKFFIERLKDEIIFIIDSIKSQYKHSSHTIEEHEKKIEFEEKRKITYKIKGYVDKILYYEDAAFIIDYKTNTKDVDKTLFEYGINIQLPMYLYLLKRIENIDVAGMYLQHILDLNSKFEPNKDVDQERKNKMKLSGYTLDDTNIIDKFDDSYDSSEVIKSLKMTKQGTWSAYSKIITNEERNLIYELIERLLYNAIDSVIDAKFDINPIIIEKKCNGCDYCQYKDICFVKPKDYKIIKDYNKTGDEDNE